MRPLRDPAVRAVDPRSALRGSAPLGAGLAFIYVPLLVVLVNSFNPRRTFGWPPPASRTQWWSQAASNAGVREALLTSVEIALGATAIALVLGTMAAFAVARYRWFGRETVELPRHPADRAARASSPASR